jgi:hypothetical protein
VALKIANVSVSEGEAEAFRRELQAAASCLRHPNLLRIFGAGAYQGRPYLVMEACTEDTLATVHERSRLTVHDALEITATIARALHAAHRRGFLHRDIKPSNVLIGLHGELLLADFGMAAPRRPLEADRLVGGTPGWMSPEQVEQRVDGERAGSYVGVESDVFSLGVLLYWLLSRRLPFGEGEDYAARVVNEEPPAPLIAQNPFSLAWAVNEICLRALRKCPDRRYPSALALVEDIDRARGGRPTANDREFPLRRATKWAYHRRFWVAAGLSVAGFGAVAGAQEIKAWGQAREHCSVAAALNAFAVYQEVRSFWRVTAEWGKKPEIAELTGADVYLPAAALARLRTLVRDDPLVKMDVDRVFVEDARGYVRAIEPTPAFGLQDSFEFRDYFQGARAAYDQHGCRSAGVVYTGRVYHSYSDGLLTLGFSTPLLETQPDGVCDFLGVLVVTSRVGSHFGLVDLDQTRSTHVQLLGLKDREASLQPLPDDRLVVVAARGADPKQPDYAPREFGQAICSELGCDLSGSAGAYEHQGHRMAHGRYENPIDVEGASRGSWPSATVRVGDTSLFVVAGMPGSWTHRLTGDLHKMVVVVP